VSLVRVALTVMQGAGVKANPDLRSVLTREWAFLAYSMNQVSKRFWAQWKTLWAMLQLGYRVTAVIPGLAVSLVMGLNPVTHPLAAQPLARVAPAFRRAMAAAAH
jgi:hypothetical protein